MRKLLIATDSFLPRWDGVARFLIEILPYLKKEFEIIIVAPNFGELKQEEFADIRMIRFPITKFHIADYNIPKPSNKEIKNAVRQSDIVWTQTLGPIGYAAMKYGKRYRKPVIAYVHSIEWELFSKGITKNEFLMGILHNIAGRFVRHAYNNKADLLMVPSKGVDDTLRIQGITTKSRIIHLATNPEKFKPPEDKDDAKMKLGLNGTILGFCGRIGKEKNIDTLYKAFLRLKEHYKDLRLILVADGPEEQKKKFEKAIITGNVDPVPYFQAMDIFVLPSLTETTSLVTMEAMATGLPVIVTKVGYVKDYVTNGINGVFTPKKNSIIMAEKIERLITNPEIREQLGTNARKTIMKHYSWDKTAEKIMQTLKEF
jgi:glycosyltransferase involved in cell wall biosynthesis